tara:strand:- start:13164 stop:13451 length:288 start_codon:yes stop_codon:yes gene_type:complete
MSIDSLPTGLKECVQDCADQLNETKALELLDECATDDGKDRAAWIESNSGDNGTKQMIVFYAQKRLEDHEKGTVNQDILKRINQSQMDAIELVEG